MIRLDIFSDPVCKVNIISLIITVIIYITEWVFVGENTDVDLATVFDFIKCTINFIALIRCLG